MASSSSDTMGKTKLYIGIAVAAFFVGFVLDIINTPTDEEKAAAELAAEQAEQRAIEAIEQAEAGTEENLKPIENLVVVDKQAPPPPTRSGAEVYQAACLACHASGVLEAPKLEAGAWDDRIAKGLEKLNESAINGLGAMPPRGGNPNVTDEEIANAINYMLAESGYDVDSLGSGDQGAAAGADETADTAKQEADTAAQTTTDPESAPKTAESDSDSNSDTASAAAVTAAATTQSASAESSPEQSQVSMPVQHADKAQLAAAGSNNPVGKQVYDTTCFTCHNVGVVNSPILGDHEAWSQLASQGMDTLYNSALNGKGQMPVKGGYPNLSKEQVIAAVDYMLEVAGIEINEAEAASPDESQSSDAVAPARDDAAAEQSTQTRATAAADSDAEQVSTDSDSGAEQADKETDANTEQAGTKQATETMQASREADSGTEQAEADTGQAAQEAPADTETEAAPLHANIDGEKVYRGICFSCHDGGIAGAPKLGDTAAWEPRIAAGMEAMYANSINGIGVMPAKGGNPALSDDEIKAAVDWMMAQNP